MEGFVPWPEEFARKYREAGYWLDKTITEVMDESFARFESRTALITDRGQRFSYGEPGKARDSVGPSHQEFGTRSLRSNCSANA
jgi:non-ribosomal peptide synthetase component E (peptide arylation enzyme)